MFGWIILIVFLPNVNTQIGNFWQITDIHIELNYSTTGDVNNDCRGVGERKKLLGIYGDYSCDSNLILLQDAVNAMKNVNPKPDFILWTGDNFPHVEETSWDKLFSSFNVTTSVITAAFPDILVIPVLGNHDVIPPRQFPWNTFQNYSDKYLTKGGWSQLIPNDQVDTWNYGGYYSVKVNSQLTVIVANTFLYQFHEKDLDMDPKGQFAWLIEQLKLAEKSNIRVIVTSHIPPGYQEFKKPFLVQPFVDKYLEIINRFSHVILTQVYAHLHRDTFRLFYDSNGILQSHAFLGPSVTPWKYPRTSTVGNNPCIRLYNYSLTLNSILNYQQYFLNFSMANKMAAEGKWPPGNWELLYNAAELYNVPNLNLTSMNQIYEHMKYNETVFDAYFRNFYSGHIEKCDELCRQWQLCAVISITEADINKNCPNPKLNSVINV